LEVQDMEKKINIILPEHILNSLEFDHNFVITRIGYYQNPTNHYIERTDLKDAVLLLCLNGSGYVQYKGKNYNIKRGDVVFLEPNVPHSYGSVGNDLWTILWVHFDGKGIPEYVKLLKKYNIDYVFNTPNYNSIAEELNNILLLLESNYNSLDIGKACCLLQLVLLNILEMHSDTVSTNNQYIKKAVGFMKDNIDNNITLDDLSRYLGISTYHTIRIFKGILTSTPMQYYNMMRMNRAAKLLRSTDMTVTEISQKLNYSSPFLFSQQFKKKIGVSPTVYKKSVNCKY
jgi:AraC family transcriptional regulator of arabinose operon